MNKTRIQWCDYTWNPITGCDRVSEGCANCYAHAIHKRFQGGDFNVTLHPERLTDKFPKKRSRIFCCSMSDLFNESVKDYERDMILAAFAPWVGYHTLIMLTKRPENAMRYFVTLYTRSGTQCEAQRFVAEHAWFGVTAENQKRLDERLPVLMQAPCAVKLLSIEPMLERMELPSLDDYVPDWVIVGPETGPKARLCDPEWIYELSIRCDQLGVSFFDKSEPFIRREFPKEKKSP